jgi:hypothetical protein
MIIIVAAVVAAIYRLRAAPRTTGRLIAILYDVTSDAYYITNNVQLVEPTKAVATIEPSSVALLIVEPNSIKPVRNTGSMLLFAEVSPLIHAGQILRTGKTYIGQSVAPLTLAKLGSVEMVIRRSDGTFDESDIVELLKSFGRYVRRGNLTHEVAIPITENISLGVTLDFGRLLGDIAMIFKEFSNAYIKETVGLDRTMKVIAQSWRTWARALTVSRNFWIQIAMIIGMVLIMIGLFYFLFLGHVL